MIKLILFFYHCYNILTPAILYTPVMIYTVMQYKNDRIDETMKCRKKVEFQNSKKKFLYNIASISLYSRILFGTHGIGIA